MKPASRISQRVSEQLLTICCRNTARAAIPLALAVLFTYILLHDTVVTPLLQAWALLCCTLIVARVVLLRIISQSDKLSDLAKRMCATFLTFLLGCGLASVLLFFSSVGLFERSMLTAIMLGVSTASYSINIGYPPLLVAYIGPLLGSCSILWAFNSMDDPNPGLSLAVSVSILILSTTLVRNGRFMFQAFSLAIETSTKLEDQSRRLSDALHRAELAKQEAETSSQSKSRFIAAASHDLRQPVHVLNLFSGALRKSSLDDRTSEIVENMNIAVTSLSAQLNALLDISKLDSGSVVPDFRSVDLHALSDSLMRELSQLAEDKRIELVNEVPESLFVRSDVAMLSQIMRNLCGNAIKYTHTGSVRLQAVRHASEVVLSIVDTGIGIESAENDRIFEEFYQVSNQLRERDQGLGLGLSIVERLIKTLDHTLTLKSSPGKGTCVSIRLQPAEPNAVATTSSDERTGQSDYPLAGYRIHLVDDETSVQNSVKAFLETVGAKVTTSASSSAAIEYLSMHQPDAVLVDLSLAHDDSGLAVIDFIGDSGLPVALITGKSIDDKALIDEYPNLLMLQKPLPDDDLLELLDYLLTTEKLPAER